MHRLRSSTGIACALGRAPLSRRCRQRRAHPAAARWCNLEQITASHFTRPATIEEVAVSGGLMIDSLLNLLFRCSHRRLTRPVAPVTKAGQPRSESYVVCLDCGKQFQYDLNTMQM